MLGGFCMEVNGCQRSEEINRSMKLWNVLSYMIIHRDREVLQTELIDLFWNNEDRSNPASALKALFYRLRTMLEPLFPDGAEPILSQRGSYSWNPAIECELDIDRFEQLCTQANDTTRSARKRITLYRSAIELYRGDFLPRLSSQMWVIPLSTTYHAMYMQAVHNYAVLLEEDERFEEMVNVCTVANERDPLDEDTQVLLIRALLRQGNTVAAMNQYEKSVDLLYRNLGVRPSEELRELYSQIMAVQSDIENDLEVIQTQLHEAQATDGAFVCDYGFFREIYRLEARRIIRAGSCIHIVLVTVTMPDGSKPPRNALNATMSQLLQVIESSLRQGDVVSRYSGSQYLILLPSANFEDSNMVMERIVSAYYRQHRQSLLRIIYHVRALDVL